MEPRAPVNYLKNADLIAEIIKSKQKFKQNPNLAPSQALTDKLATMLKLLVDKYSQKGNWRNYSYIDDMKSEANLVLCNNALKFDENKYNNPFAYYTQIVTRSFVSFRASEDKIRQIRDDIRESTGQTPSLTRQLENDRKNELEREGVPEDRAKLIKEIKKYEAKLEKIDSVIARLKEANEGSERLDKSVARLLKADVKAYTQSIRDAKRLVPEGFFHHINPDQEIAGVVGTVITLGRETPNLSLKRIVVAPHHKHKVPISLVELILLTVRDEANRRLRMLRGEKAVMRRPLGKNAVDKVKEFERIFEEDPRPARDEDEDED